MGTLDRPRTSTPAETSPLLLAPLSDSALAKLIANGGDGAFEVLYERYRADLSRYCRALLRNPEDAEEAFQGTMLNALRALRSGDGGRTMRPWLYRIAHNQCASMIRARRPSSALSPEQPSPLDPPEEQAAISEQIRHLRADLGSLPALQRSALVMREMSGLSHRSIAAALAVEPADARQLVYEARRSLDECRIGREAGCDEVRGQIADGDRRRLRSRRVRAHLRGCEHCSAYVASQSERRRGYAALAPAMPAAAGKQVFDRVMGTPVSGAVGGSAIGIPGGVAGTIAGLAAGFSPGTSAKAWARLPEGAATGMAGAGATAGVALLSLALTALLLNGGNAAYGSWSEPAPPAAQTTVLEVAVVGPPGTADIGYRAVAAPSDFLPEADSPPASPPPVISIRGAVIAERPAPPPAPVSASGTRLVVAEAPEATPPARPGAEVARPRLVDNPAPPPPAPSTVPVPADEQPDEPVPAPVVTEPVIAEVPVEVGSTPDPEPVEEPAAEDIEVEESVIAEVPVEVGSTPDPEPAEEPALPEPEPVEEPAAEDVEVEEPVIAEVPVEVGSTPDPEPVEEPEAIEGENGGDAGQKAEPSDPTGDDADDSPTPSVSPETASQTEVQELAPATEVCP